MDFCTVDAHWPNVLGADGLVLNCRVLRRQPIRFNKRTCGQSGQVSNFIQISSSCIRRSGQVSNFIQISSSCIRRIGTIEAPKQSARAFNSTFNKTTTAVCGSTRAAEPKTAVAPSSNCVLSPEICVLGCSQVGLPLHLEHVKYFLAVMVDDLHGDLARFGRGKWSARTRLRLLCAYSSA
jgi:hypothetical protein